MTRCLQLAALGRGLTSPNPMVGSVIVDESGRILGEGFHHRYGGPHAERLAIAKVREKQLLRDATLYVNLEPCSHHGKTPPCADLIIESGIPRVVTGMEDPNPLVSGTGIRRLREAGIEVSTGILADASRSLNRRFVTWHTHHRPYVILKWAQTRDGFIDKERAEGDTAQINWITGQGMKQLVHKWRTEEDGILVGGSTLLHDDPQLTARDWAGRNPLRIGNDLRGILPTGLALLDGSSSTLILSPVPAPGYAASWERVSLAGPVDGRNPSEVLKVLFERGIQSLIVEGGATTHQMFIDAGLWDEARVLEGNKTFGSGVRAPVLPVQATAVCRYGREYVKYFTPSFSPPRVPPPATPVP